MLGRLILRNVKGIFIVTLSLEGWQTKAKEAPFPYEARLTLLDTNPVFQSLGMLYGCILYVVRLLYKNASSCGRVKGTFSDDLLVQVGLHQGSLFSSLLS